MREREQGRAFSAGRVGCCPLKKRDFILQREGRKCSKKRGRGMRGLNTNLILKNKAHLQAENRDKRAPPLVLIHPSCNISLASSGHPLGASLECRSSGPSPSLLNRNTSYPSWRATGTAWVGDHTSRKPYAPRVTYYQGLGWTRYDTSLSLVHYCFVFWRAFLCSHGLPATCYAHLRPHHPLSRPENGLLSYGSERARRFLRTANLGLKRLP